MVVFSTYAYIVWFTKMLKAKVINCTKLLVLSLQIICIICAAQSDLHVHALKFSNCFIFKETPMSSTTSFLRTGN